MSNPTNYELTISAQTPETVIEGEPFETIFRVKNKGQNDFPGGTISIIVSWPALGPNATVVFPIVVNKPLAPGDSFEYARKETPLIAGYTFFNVAFSVMQGTKTDLIYFPKGVIRMFHEDGRQLTRNFIFGAVRAKSHEEIYSKQEVDVALKALRWAIYAFAATVGFGLIDVLLRFFL